MADKDVGAFLGAKAPTSKTVFLKLKGVHDHLQTSTKRQSSRGQAVRMTAKHIIEWWTKTDIKVKAEKGIIKMIDKMDTEWQDLFKQRN